MQKFVDLTRFLLELDALKLVQRRTYISGGVRPENSAEHSWHLAMACWAFANYLQRPVSLERVLKFALIHDLGEIDAGDTFLYAANRGSAHNSEREGITRIASLPGNTISDLLFLWDEQEYSSCAEAQLVKVMDRLLPFLHNLASGGRAWMENTVAKSQVLKAHEFVKEYDPEIYRWVEEQVGAAVGRGWLVDN